MVNIFVWGIGINVALLIIYYFLHQQIEKFGAVREQVLLSVRRSRASYYYIYLIAVVGLAMLIYSKSRFIWEFAFGSLAVIILVDILHDRMHLVLTSNELISVRGFLNTKSVGIEYKDIVIVEVYDHVTGRMLGYGNVRVNIGGSGKELIFKDIPHYLKVKNMVEQRKMAQERGLRQRRAYRR